MIKRGEDGSRGSRSLHTLRLLASPAKASPASATSSLVEAAASPARGFDVWEGPDNDQLQRLLQSRAASAEQRARVAGEEAAAGGGDAAAVEPHEERLDLQGLDRRGDAAEREATAERHEEQLDLQGLGRRAEAAEREAATAREALAASQRETMLLRRELVRLRERVEAAELRRAPVPVPAADTDVRALRAQLRASDERALRGEVLVTKLRSFIAEDAQRGAAPRLA